MQTLVKIFAAFIIAHLAAIGTPTASKSTTPKSKPVVKKEKKISCSDTAKDLKAYQKLI